MGKYITDERTGIKYELNGDYYIIAGDDEPVEEALPLGKYGIMRMTYLKKSKKSQYFAMLMNDTLNSYLHDVDEQANRILEQTVKAFAEADGCDENLKATDPMKWVGLMNNYRHSAEEIIFKELIFV